MPPLSSMLLQREVATLREVDEALARQALHGGDLVTNLLEVAAVDEGALLRVLSEFHGISAMAPGRLPVADPNAVILIPREVALDHAVVPLRISGEQMEVVVIEPLSPTLLDDLRFSVGLRLEQRLAVAARVRFSLSRTFDIPLERRDLRVLARLEGLADPSPSEAPPSHVPGDSILPPHFPGHPTPSAVAPPPPTSEASAGPEDADAVTAPIETGAAPGAAFGGQPFDRAEAASAATQDPEGPPEIADRPEDEGDEHAERPAAIAVPSMLQAVPLRFPPEPRPYLPKRLGATASSARTRRKGPFTLTMARDALDATPTHGGILRVLFDFARQYFEFLALFLVREDLAEGVDASGPGVDREHIRGIGVPLDLDGVLSLARHRKLNVLAVPDTEGVDAALRQDLRRTMRREVLVIPVMIRQRVVALLFGDDGAEPVDMQQVGDVIAMVPLVSAALERLILRKKLRGQGSSRPPEEEPRRRDTLRGLQATAGASVSRSSLGQVEDRQSNGPISDATAARMGVIAPFPADLPAEQTTRGGPPRRITSSFLAKPPHADAEGSKLHASSAGPAVPTAAGSEVSATAGEAKRRITARLGVLGPAGSAGGDAIAAGGSDQSEGTGSRDAAAGPGVSSAATSVRGTELEVPRARPQTQPYVSPAADSVRTPTAPPDRARATDRSAQGTGAGSQEREMSEPEPVSANVTSDTSSMEPTGEVRGPGLLPDDAAPDVVVAEADDGDEMVLAVLDELQRSPEPRPAGPDSKPGEADLRETFVATHMVVEGPRLPPKSSVPSDVGLPLVMVDVKGVVAELLDTLARDEISDDEAESIRNEIVRLSDQAAPLVAERFPGPTVRVPDPTKSVLPPVGECGPVLRVASLLGRRAMGPFEALMQAPDSNTRFWCVMLLAEMGGTLASRAVLAGVFDEDDRVRLGARASMRTAAGRRAWVAEVRERMRRAAESGSEPVRRRVQAIEALADLRERSTVPVLIDLLESKQAEVHAAAHAALQQVSRRGLADSTTAWRGWWEKSVARDRPEWLIEALALEGDPHAAGALEELEELAGDSFGYEPGQTSEERAGVVDRFRTWWEDEGSTRITEPPGGPG